MIVLHNFLCYLYLYMHTINKLLLLLGINENNNEFSVKELEKNKQEIIEMMPSIRKYFKSGRWSCFNKSEDKVRLHMSVIRCVLKNNNYKLSLRKILKLENGKYIEEDTIYTVTYENP